ncbi:DNA adenine methylase [Arthrobacter sp. SLBN-112]|uniref:DNA adenine methylase n=1 Tax=Arthrobacter sp. SLBN-112 TaxID=2768452 RepID=UPI0027B02F69|nr:DNA adenine methylase [Arthrobacter sp. SLBN-112]MDQ0802170.1 DNA adenine methylase [Arthrobacter sp. SLBN-112]
MTIEIIRLPTNSPPPPGLPRVAPRLAPEDAHSGAEAFAQSFVRDEPRQLFSSVHPVAEAQARMRHQSPLRYPGAKTGFASVVAELIDTARTSKSIPPVELFVEPFAGGSSTALRLLGNGTVRRALLADADPLVSAFWQVAASDPANLIARMKEEHKSFITPGGSAALERWDYWRGWTVPVGMKAHTARFETAMRCLFLNRTTFSGILHGGAGPIGGRAQKSEYGIGCRFMPDALETRIAYVGELYSKGRIADVWCGDWRATLDQIASTYKTIRPESVLVYLDPPYLEKSSKLYNVSFEDEADASWKGQGPHLRLAAYLMSRIPYRWILSYDVDPELTDSCLLYGRSRMTPNDDARRLGAKSFVVSKKLTTLRYTAASNGARSGSEELLITTLPKSVVDRISRLRPNEGSVEALQT